MNYIYSQIVVKNLIKHIKYKKLSYKWILLVVIFFIINASTIKTLNQYAQSFSMTYNVWDYILYSINNSRLYIYIYIPLTLYVSLEELSGNNSYIYIIRFKNAVTALLSNIINVLANNILFYIILISTILCTSSNITFSLEWSELMSSGQFILNKDIVELGSPLIVSIAGSIYFILSLSIFSILVVFSYALIRHRILSFMPTLTLWTATIVSLISYKNEWKFAYIYLDNLLIFSNSVNLNKYGILIFCIFYIILLNSLIFLCKKNINSKDVFIEL